MLPDSVAVRSGRRAAANGQFINRCQRATADHDILYFQALRAGGSAPAVSGSWRANPANFVLAQFFCQL